MKTEFGIIGLGVMGKSLARNFANNGFSLSLFNRHVDNIEENVATNFINQFSELSNSQGFDNLETFVNSLQTPRKILIMVNAGKAVDMVIDNLLSHIEPGDILIDGGNSHYKKTDKRGQLLSNKGIHFIGMGVSGGEEGALTGPSLMPGGHMDAYKLVEGFLQNIAAKDDNNNPCCKYIGTEGSGHFVKMVHNGIEYAEMQIIAEAYSILRFINKLEPTEIASIFETWNHGDTKNYLLEITIDILKKKEGDTYLIDLILDQSSHKGTGSWTTIASAELGAPFTLSSAALNARFVSALKEKRVTLSQLYEFNENTSLVNVDSLKKAYQLARIINHYQGLDVIENASNTYGLHIDLKNTVSVWTNGCIIASELIKKIISIIETNSNILESDYFVEVIKTSHHSLKDIVLTSLNHNIPIPCFSESLNYLNSVTQESGTGNIIQAQRDYFGAHTYKRKDDPTGPSHHTNWKS